MCDLSSWLQIHWNSLQIFLYITYVGGYKKSVCPNICLLSWITWIRCSSDFNIIKELFSSQSISNLLGYILRYCKYLINILLFNSFLSNLSSIDDDYIDGTRCLLLFFLCMLALLCYQELSLYPPPFFVKISLWIHGNFCYLNF